jgi:hypothetical protein
MGVFALMMNRAKSAGGGPVGPYEPEATTYFAAVAAVPGSTVVTDLQKQRLNNWIVDRKVKGIYSEYRGVFPFYGGIAAAHRINLINPAALATFNGSYVHSTSGAKPDGATAYMQTGINLKTYVGSSHRVTMEFYSRTDSPTIAFDLGADESSISSQAILSCNTGLGIVGKIGNNSGANQAIEGAYDPKTNPSIGYHVVTRVSDTSLLAYRHGGIIATNNVSSTIGIPNREIYANAYNNNGVADLFSDRQCCWIALVSTALSDTHIFDGNILVEGIQHAFTRGVQ